MRGWISCSSPYGRDLQALELAEIVLDAGWGSSDGWDPRTVDSAGRLEQPNWFMTGGPQPPLFPESEEQKVAREKRMKAMMAAMAKMRAAQKELDQASKL